MSEHTLPPWVFKDRAVYGGDNHGMIANLTYHATRLDDDSTANANGVLMAASPDLLAACKGMVSGAIQEARMVLWDGPGGTTAEIEAEKFIAKCEQDVIDAIAKAEEKR